MATIQKKITVKGKAKKVSFRIEFSSVNYNHKEYKKRTRWGTFTQKEFTCNCLFVIDGKGYPLECLTIRLAAGGYSRYFLIDGLKFNDSHKKVIEYILNK